MPRKKKEISEDFRDPNLKSFRNFLWLCFSTLRIKPTKLQYEVADILEHGPKRLIISAYRGFGKSYITAMFVLWHLYWNPKDNILIVSASKNRSDSFSQFCLKLIMDIPELQWMAPGKDMRRSAIQFDVSGADPSQAASVVSMGIGSQLTGMRANIIIADDVEVPKTSNTQGAREKLTQGVTEFESILKPDKEARIIYLGTPQCEDSLYNGLVKTGYKRIVWPIRLPGDKWMQHNGHELARSVLELRELNPDKITGHGLDGLLGMGLDDRFTEEELIEREAKQGKSNFSLQFMLDTSLSDQERYPLRIRDLMVLSFDKAVPESPIWSADETCAIKDLDSVGFRGDRWYRPAHINGNWVPFEHSIMAIDPSGHGKDETAYMVVKGFAGMLYLAEAGGLSGGYLPENLKTLSAIAAKHSVNLILCESNFGDGMFEQLLRPVLHKVHPCQIESIRNHIQKEKRIIDTLEPIFNTHRLVVNREVIEADLRNDDGKQLFRQITRITKERNSLQFDDRIDCLAMAISWFKDKVNRDTEQELKRKRNKAYDKEIAKYWMEQRRYSGAKQDTFLSRITGR